eukprot:CAMPEP_0170359502 /NCGR_PEP_ID=MMETSP0117_2-20130122/2785_1 /TAXON_ID=400756 /ORGANISM="Durinskia baltica, Strain CSIRO CS-38" /LENGTH=282 /DNA_ID=CAMNT_0010613761 /DNA_START=94 /DNA_END=938 /DNA_ORIENTATION=-
MSSEDFNDLSLLLKDFLEDFSDYSNQESTTSEELSIKSQKSLLTDSFRSSRLPQSKHLRKKAVVHKVKSNSIGKTRIGTDRKHAKKACSPHEASVEVVPKQFKLIVFPSFEKRDSLIYFPHSMTRMLNSGDHAALSKMMHSYVHPDCDVTFCNSNGLNYMQLLDVFSIGNMVHPDSMMCVHNTKVESSEIRAVMYFKFTDCKQLVDAVKKTVDIPHYIHSVGARAGLKQVFASDDNAKDQQQQQQMLSLIDSNEDLVVYGKMDVSLKVNDFSKKIVGFMFQA